MVTDNSTSTQFQEEEFEKQQPSITAKELLWICVSRWYLFVIALAVAFGVAYYYIQTTPKVYMATMEVLVNDNAGDQPDVATIFSDMEVMKSNQNINNEMVMLKSPVVIDEVVRRLGLEVTYTVPDRLRTRVLYGPSLPLFVDFLSTGEDGRARFEMLYKGDGTLELGPFTTADEKFEDLSKDNNITLSIDEIEGDSIATPVGFIRITRNHDFTGDRTATLDIDVDHVGVKAAMNRVMGALNVAVEDNYSSVIQVHLADVNTDRALATLACIYDVYREKWLEHRNLISMKTTEFINERVQVIEEELADVDREVSSTQANTPVAGQQGAETSNVNAINNQLMEKNAQLSLLKSTRSRLLNNATRYELLDATGLGIDNRVFSYNELLADYKKKLSSAENNPYLQGLRDQIDLAQQEIISSLDAQILQLQTAMSALNSQLGASLNRQAAAPVQAMQLLEPQRQQKVKEELYLYLLKKREENELSQAFSAYNTRLVSPPTITGQVSAGDTKIYLIAIACGLLIPGLLIFAREYFNTKVRGRRDIEKLAIPFVGEIPMATRKKPWIVRIFKRSKKLPHAAIVVKKGKHNYINEAFRVIRTNLDFMIPAADTGSGKVIMLTSANPNSGKTFTTINLAIVLALKGKRVAMIDLDLRKASLSKSFEGNDKGMSNLLAGSADAGEIVVRNIDGIEGLDLYPTGPIPPNPSELLYSPKMAEFIEQLRRQYDYVFIDCPPAEVVADAKIINGYTDLTLFVVRAGLLERSMLGEIQKFYNNRRYGNMSIILNGTEAQGKTYLSRGNRYAYGYGYSYGYGYTSSSDK